MKTRENYDVQSEIDYRSIPLEKVGVKNIKYPIIVEDRSCQIQHTVADIDLFVDLPHHHRGTHMSRFMEVLYQYRQESLIHNLEQLLREVKQRLKSEKAYINIRFPYFMEKIAPVSRLKSLLNYDCFFEVSLAQVLVMILGVSVPITALCPCSKEISRYGAHNQRSYVTVKIISESFIWLEELIEMIEQSGSSEIYPLLKRPDEKYVTEKAYDNPVFAEDLVRSITEQLQKDHRIKWFSVEAENWESIHNHNAYAFVEKEK